MAWGDLREYLDSAEEKEEILPISEPVDPDLELGAVWAKQARTRGRILRHPPGSVKGYPDWEVVTNVFGTNGRIADAFQIPEEDLFHEVRNRAQQRQKPNILDDGPINENEYLGDEVDVTTQFPNIRWNDRDGGPYITYGPSVLKDPEYGTNTAIYRVQIHASDLITLRLSPVHHGHTFAERAKSRGETEMEVAIYVGGPPSATIGPSVNVPVSVDEYDVIGALRDEPLDLVKCKTVDLEVPAMAELVVEGKIQFDESPIPEGPFGEFCGAYSGVYEEPPIKVTRVAHREDPVYFGGTVGKPVCASHLIGSLFYSVSFYDTVSSFMPEVKDVYFPPESTLLECVIQLDETLKGPGVAKNTLYRAMAVHPTAKNYIIVDEDIDLRNRDDLQWALTTRVQADRDVITLPDGATTPLDPSSTEKGVTDKIGIDATKHEDFRGPVISIPDEMERRGEEILSNAKR